MNKRGQIAVFVIIGLIILGVLFFFTYSKPSEQNLRQTVISDPEGVRLEVQQCFEETTMNGLALLREGSLKHGMTGELPVFYREGQITIPALQELEGQLADFVEQKTENCARNKDYSYDVSFKASEAKVVFSENEVNIWLKFPVEVSSGDKAFTYSDYTVKHNIRFPEIYDISLGILEGVKENPHLIPLGYMSSNVDHNFTINPYPDLKVIVYTISELEPNFDGKPFYYRVGAYVGDVDET